MKSVALYGGLLTVALVGSYLSWTDDGEDGPSEGEVAMYRASAGDVAALRYQGETIDVTVTRKEDARGPYTWIEVEEERKLPLPVPATPEAGPADEAAPDDAPPEPAFEIERVRTAFVGSANAMNLLDDFSPLHAKRSLDRSLAEDERFGFETPEGTVTVTRRAGGDEQVVIGGTAFGTRDRYAMHADKLYLLDDAVVRPLQFATTRLLERRLHPLAIGDLTRVQLAIGSDSLALDQQNRDDPEKAYWTRAGSSERDVSAGLWVDSLLRLRAAAEVERPEGDLPTLLTVTLASGGEQWTVALRGDPDGDARYADSAFLRGAVRVPSALADELMDDAKGLLSP